MIFSSMNIKSENAANERSFCERCRNCERFQPSEYMHVCAACKCKRYFHAIILKSTVSLLDRIKDSTVAPIEIETVMEWHGYGYAWLPDGVPYYQINEFFALLDDEDVPLLGTAGHLNRDRKLLRQIPDQDIDTRSLTAALTPGDQRAFVECKSEMIARFSIGKVVRETVPKKCEQCNDEIPANQFSISAAIGIQKLYWHPNCFRCQKCADLLVDFGYCYIGFSVFCIRHFNEQAHMRCEACDELIYQADFVSAMNHHYHRDHFACWTCKENLVGKKFIVKDDNPWCLTCFEAKFCHVCDACRTKIKPDSTDIVHNNRHWHTECFICMVCDKPIPSTSFVLKDDKPCCVECYKEKFAARCSKCNAIFKSGTKKLKYENKEYHEACFVCNFCDNPISSSSFIQKDLKICCQTCYNDLFVTKCAVCKKTVDSGLVHKEKTYHRDCFRCALCDKNIASEKFITHNEETLCSQCYWKMYSKKCHGCSHPITGDEPTKYVEFDHKCWHDTCFVCSRCRNSLVNKSFMTKGMDILCAQCAQE